MKSLNPLRVWVAALAVFCLPAIHAATVTVDSANVLVDTRDPLSLTVTPSSHGAVSGAGLYAPGSAVILTPTPSAGYVFAGWTGAATGTQNPLTVTLAANQEIGATFAPDTGDSDGDGLTNFEEVTIYATNTDLADSDGDGLADGVAVQMGLDPLADHAALVQIIQDSRETFGLYSKQELTDLRPGSTTVKVLPSAGGVQLRMKVQQSSDLKNWQDAGEAVFEQAADPAAPKRFFRFGVK